MQVLLLEGGFIKRRLYNECVHFSVDVDSCQDDGPNEEENVDNESRDRNNFEDNNDVCILYCVLSSHFLYINRTET